MANIQVPKNPGFPDVHQWDYEDDVIGGVDGIATRPIKQLTERTEFLKERFHELNSLFDKGTDNNESNNESYDGMITISDDKMRLVGFEKLQYRVVGEYHDLSFQPTPIQLAKWRYLILNFQIIEIALYQELCEIKWVGAELNSLAPFWYRCDADGTRNVNGLYMRVEDGRGMFRRGAGVNAVFKAANDTPYDGKDIGEPLTDTIRNIEGILQIGIIMGIASQTSGAFESTQFSPRLNQGSSSNPSWGNVISFSAGRVVPVSHENRPVSISSLVCISY